jgi:lysyl-tRNA synthetase class 2
MQLTEELVTFVATEVNGTTLTNFNGTEIDLSKWTKLSMREAIIKFWPEDKLGPAPKLADFASNETLRAYTDTAHKLAEQMEQFDLHMDLEPQDRIPILARKRLDAGFWMNVNIRLMSPEYLGKGIADIFEWLAEEHLIQPTIIYDFPLAVSPLSKQKPDEPDWVERFEFYIGGFEVGNAFSELNDPIDQRNRFLQQLEEKNRGDDEAHAMDEDYVRALGYGLPPTAGEGIGIDRLTMILTGSKSIRDVILFPLLRPQAKQQAAESPDDAPKS